MAAKLGNKTLRRNVHIYGVENDVIFAMDSHGISFKAPGTKLGVHEARDRRGLIFCGIL